MLKKYFSVTRNIISQTFRNALNHNVPLHGAAIAFYTIFSVAPLILIILTASEYLLSEQLVRENFYRALTELWGAQITDSLKPLVESYAQIPTSMLTHIVAIGTLIFGATTVITQLKSSLNTIWEVQAPKKSGIYKYLVDRGLSLLIIVLITTLFIGSLVLELIIPIISNALTHITPFELNPVTNIGLPISSLLLSFCLFSIIFRILPDVTTPWKYIFVGAILTSILFYGGKTVISYYLNNNSIQLAYRTAGSFVIFLIWIYYNVQILLLGAEFTHVFASYKEKEKENKVD